MAGSQSYAASGEPGSNAVEIAKMQFIDDQLDCTDNMCNKMTLGTWARVLSVRAIDSNRFEILILKDFALEFGTGSSSSGEVPTKPGLPPVPPKRRLYQSD